jgi:hypothetical protein
MDEAGSRLAYPGRKYIIAPFDVKEHYAASPENRKSVIVIETVIVDGRELLPPFIITPGKNIIDN